MTSDTATIRVKLSVNFDNLSGLQPILVQVWIIQEHKGYNPIFL